MSVSATQKQWTLADLHALPDDGNRYELVHGALFMTPAPSFRHEMIASRLADEAKARVARTGPPRPCRYWSPKSCLRQIE